MSVVGLSMRSLGILGGGWAAVGGGPSARLLAMAGLQNVWICAQDLQLIRADRIISLLVPIGTGYGAASPDDQALHRAVCAEIEGGAGDGNLAR